MSVGVQIVAGWMAFVVLFALGLLVWADRSGQLENVEDAKYVPFRESEPEDWPGRTASSGGAVRA